MSGGGKGGQQTSTTQLPKWYEDMAKHSFDKANQAASIGYMPWMGLDVAAFSPQQELAFQQANNASSAFGMGSAGGGYLPQAQRDASGAMGYSSYPGYLAAQQAWEKQMPEQAGRYWGMYGGAAQAPQAPAQPGGLPPEYQDMYQDWLRRQQQGGREGAHGGSQVGGGR